VVNIEQNVSHPLNSEKAGVFAGTGFIVDSKMGVIATNFHIVGSSPQQVKITFENGESCGAVSLHYDAWHDFAFYRFDPKSVCFEVEEAVLGDSFNLEEQSDVFLIGNSDEREYSVKFGTVTNLCVDCGKRHSYGIQTSFDRTHGSSGSPVFDSRGRVVAIHTSGSNTSSFELRVEYIKDALRQLKEKNCVQRGDIGVELDLLRISDGTLHYKLPAEAVSQLKAHKPGIKYIVHVGKLAPLATASGILQAGDLVMELDGHVIGDNQYLFDKLVDQKVDSTVEITIYRNGEKQKHQIPVRDAEKLKITKFVLFAGGIFHDISVSVRAKFEVHVPGTFLSHVIKGSCLHDLGTGSDKHPTSYATVIEEVSGVPTPDLASFVAAVQSLVEKGQRHIYVLCRNLRDYRTCTKPMIVVLDLKFHPLREFSYSRETLDWIETKGEIN
jgi:S1-C subfamily serine protease